MRNFSFHNLCLGSFLYFLPVPFLVLFPFCSTSVLLYENLYMLMDFNPFHKYISVSISLMNDLNVFHDLQEKQREKKHRKEKKDKEKRDSKEKKEKDRIDEKHREKKDKKEKQRDKKEKDRDKDKDKVSNSDEKKLPGKSEDHDGEKTSNEKKLLPKSEGHNREKFIQKDKEKNRDSSSISSEKKVARQFSGYSGEKLSQNSYLAGDSKDSKFLQELGRRVRDEDRATGNQLVEKFTSTDRKRDEGVVRLVAKATHSLDGGKEKKKDKTGGDERKLDEHGVRDDARFSGHAMVQSLAGVVQTRTEGVPRPLEKDVESKTEGKENTKKKEGDDKRGDKHKDKDREKKGQGKEKDRDKEKKKEEKAKMKSEHKKVEKDILKDKKKNDLLGTHDMKTLRLPNSSDKNAISEANIRKRKDSETNGFYHANDNRPNKLPRPSSSPHSSTETNKLTRPISSSHPLTETNVVPRPTSSPHPLTGNGKILEPGQTSALFTSDRQASANNLKADNKERKVNGMISSQPLSVSTAKSLFTTVQADQIAEVSMNPPHPDTKYLNQILSVPKREELSKDHDLEWLIHGSDSQLQKPKVISAGNDEMPEVWAEAMRIESADVCALPYVIPF
ncbi:hypothetical protein Pint_25504 [Pistacia integerrima]|uniref:Uncharacterized protein n=1 Tax=Pistacia integerrima TaxID=434235 RepID=A0ACC0YEA3_9ROSI|nr:hypothetical protein Pint_25504 [Pistacia integerrima]